VGDHLAVLAVVQAGSDPSTAVVLRYREAQSSLRMTMLLE
jgi:hypothetical protein